MTPDTIIRILQQALLLAVLISAPALLAALLVGTVVSIFQAATHIHESSLLSVPKIIAVSAVLAFAGVWMVMQVIAFGQALLSTVPQVR